MPTHGIIDYILTVVDPFFEEWQKANPEKDYHDYTIVLEKMSKSGGLFDLIKMESVSNAYLSRISTDRLYDETLAWAKKYKPELLILLESDPEYVKAAMNIERFTPKDPKRFTTFVDVDSQIRFFFDEEWEKLLSARSALPVIFTPELIKKFVDEYVNLLDLNMTQEEWFAQLKDLWGRYGVGKVGDFAMLLRVQLCCAARTPDLYSVMKVMGKERVVKRLKKLV